MPRNFPLDIFNLFDKQCISINDTTKTPAIKYKNICSVSVTLLIREIYFASKGSKREFVLYKYLGLTLNKLLKTHRHRLNGFRNNAKHKKIIYQF